MPYSRTGSPELDGIIARGIRYGQTRRVEVMLALLMMAVGFSLVANPNLSLPSFRIIFTFAGQAHLGWVALGIGTARLYVISLNGKRNMPAFRIAGCIIAVLFWLGWFASLAVVAPPIVPLCPMSLVMMFGELWAARIIGRDAFAFDTLGLQSRFVKGSSKEAVRSGGPS